MGSLRKLKRSVAKHPLEYWRATQKSKQDAEAVKQKKEAQAAKDTAMVNEVVEAWEKAHQVQPIP